MENEIVKLRWKNVKQPKVLIATITDSGNVHCQNAWLGRAMFLQGIYDLVIFENSETIENFRKLEFASHNYSNIIVKRGKTGFRTTGDKICANRNLVLNYIRKHTEYDYLVMLDSDVFPPTNLIPQFLKQKKDIISAFCYVWASDMVQKRPACNFFKEDIKKGLPIKWLEESKPRLISIAQSGLGCVMFKTDILKKYKYLVFFNKKIKKDGEYVMNEDLTFTGYLQEKGHKIWLDQFMLCKHLAKGSGVNGI